MTVSNKTGFMYHNIREAAITLIPGGIGTGVWLSNIHTGLGIVASVLTIIWLGYRVAIARKELKSKK